MFKVEIITFILLIICFGLKKKHPLIVLLTLELYLLIVMKAVVRLGNEIFFALLLICIGACEGAVGLGSLIRRTRVKRSTSIV